MALVTVLCLLIDFFCLGKITVTNTKNAKFEVRAVLLFLMAKHYSTAATHWEVYTFYISVLLTTGYEF